MGKIKNYMMEKIEIIERKTGIDFFEIQDVVFESEIDLGDLLVLSNVVKSDWTIDTIKSACKGVK